MRFSKIALNTKRVLIEYQGEGSNPKDTIATMHSSIQKPKEEFTNALTAFKGFVRQLTATTPKWMEDVTVTAVHISEQKGGRRGVTISAMRPVADTNAPFVFSTPLMVEPKDDDDATTWGSLAWPDGLDEALTKLQAAASRYIAGDREQGDLFVGAALPGDEDAEVEEEEEEETAGARA